ncbi:hypothetical protein BO94DRAFT_457304, partial [Aspergillus sclerotioniger CBS 115572]
SKQSKKVSCRRCHAQKVKCSGQRPCSRCQLAGCGDACTYVARDRKVRVDESYLEQLIKDSEELRRNRQRGGGNSSTLDKSDSNTRNPLLQDQAWFQPYEGDTLPVFVSEAACTGFATRLCQCLDGDSAPVSHIPRNRYIAESTLTQVTHAGIQWPSLIRARLLVKTALDHASPFFHVALRKPSLDYLQTIYEQPDTDPVLMCKYFALFALGEAYSSPNNRSNQGLVPGMEYHARAMNLIAVLPERPTIVHIEALLILALFSQFLNRWHSAYLMVGNALRFALLVGLNHNIPDNQCPDPTAREHRLRLWWTIYIFDRFWGLKLGLPVQLSDDDIHVGLPMDLDTPTYTEDFVPSLYQVAFIKLAQISTRIMRTIYSRTQFTETFLQREQRLLIELRQWMQSLPGPLRLQTNQPNPKGNILIHLQFNYCVILAIRPILLRILDNLALSPQTTISPTLAALKDACIHSARHMLVLCADEWTNGSSATYGYAFAQYSFTAALILIIACLVPDGGVGNTAVEDLTSVQTATEMLSSFAANGSLVADDLYRHLVRAQQCLRTGRFASQVPFHPSHHSSSYGPPSAGMQWPIFPSIVASSTPGRGAGDVLSRNAETALDETRIQEFVAQPAEDLGLLDSLDMMSGSELDMWLGLPLWTP